MKKTSVRAMAAGFALACAGTVPAADQVWNDSGPNNIWSVAQPNWLGGGAWTNSNHAIFAGGGGSQTGETVEVRSSVLVAAITIQTNGYVFKHSTAVPGYLQIVGNPSVVTVAPASSTAAIGALIVGSSGLTKAGAGTLQLNTNNTCSGAVVIQAGSLQLTKEALPSASSITVSNNAQLVYTTAVPVTNAAPLTLTGLGTSSSVGRNDMGAFIIDGSGGNLTQNGAIVLSPVAAGGVVRVGGYGWSTGFTLTLNGAISGNASLSFHAQAGGKTGQIFLNAKSTYTGGTTFRTVAANILTTLGVDDALPVATVLTLETWNVITHGSTNYSQLILNGHSQTLAGIVSATNANNVVTNRITGGSAALSTLTVDNAADYTFVGVLGGPGADDNNLALVKKGAGTLTLTRDNTYAGATAISNGVLRLTSAQGASVLTDVSVASGAMAELAFTGTNTIRRLYVGGVLQAINKAYGAAQHPTALSGSGYFLTTEGAAPRGTLISLK